MYRLREPSAAIRDAVGPALTDAFALLTELGSVPVVLVGLSVLYWVGDRRSSATLLSYTLVALAVTLLLKEGLALPRPPEAVRAVPVEDGSHGFPSGHAIAAAAVYGGLLVTHRRLRRPTIAVPVLSLAALVGLSRVVIGVHYLGDILVGFAVGALVVGALWVGVGHRADLACLVAAVVAVGAIAVTGASTYALVALGGSLGGAGAFRWIDVTALPEPDGVGDALLLIVVGLAFVGAMFAVSTALGLVPLALAGAAVLVVGLVAAPSVLEVSTVSRSIG